MPCTERPDIQSVALSLPVRCRRNSVICFFEAEPYASSLYEPAEFRTETRCPPHLIRPQTQIHNVYGQVHQQFAQAGQTYRQNGQGFQMDLVQMQQLCVGACAAYMLCRFCC